MSDIELAIARLETISRQIKAVRGDNIIGLLSETITEISLMLAQSARAQELLKEAVVRLTDKVEAMERSDAKV